jgi:hypothetical protein
MLEKTNVAIAAYITAYARCALYEAMDVAPEKVLYCDTDSVIFAGLTLEERGRLRIDARELGAWKIEADGIRRFVGLGPKTYAYEDGAGVQHVKSKGFSVGFSLDEYLMLVREPESFLIDRHMEFERITSDRPRIRTVIVEKKLMNCFDKRRVVDDGRTVPWGWIKKDA